MTFLIMKLSGWWWSFLRGRNKGHGGVFHGRISGCGGVLHGGETVDATRSRAIVGPERVCVCVGNVTKIPAVVKERGG